MTKPIIAAQQFSGNKEIFLSKHNFSDSSVSTAVFSNRGFYIGYRAAREMVNQLLFLDREILVPTKVPCYSVAELADKLDITLLQANQLKKLSPSLWRKLASKINLQLVRLYCNTKFSERK